MNKNAIRKLLRVRLQGKGDGNPVGKVSSINYVDRINARKIITNTKVINKLGMVLDYRCARIVDDDLCLGRVTDIKGTAQCKICGAKWIQKPKARADGNNKH